MSNADDIMAEDVAAAVFDTTSPSSPTETVVYTSKDDVATTAQATIEPVNVGDPDRGPNARYDVEAFRAGFQTADVTTPDEAGKGTLTYNGKIYGLITILWSDPSSWMGLFEYARRARLDTGDSTREGI